MLVAHQANTYFLVIIVFRTTGRTGVCYKHIAVDKDTTAHQVIETALKKFQFEVSTLIDGLHNSGTWPAPPSLSIGMVAGLDTNANINGPVGPVTLRIYQPCKIFTGSTIFSLI